MKAVFASILIAAVTASPAALAKDQPGKQGVGHLKQALAAVATTASLQGKKPADHFNPKVDRDQGDDHANPGAILKVCSKDTPAVHRAAICPTGVSPE